MNVFNAKDAYKHPQTFGKRSNYRHAKAKVIEKAIGIVKAVDSTRLAYSHADGNLGDIASANNYPNFTPLQEREEYFLEWAKSGDMPYILAETGAPYRGNWFKGKQFLFTEYAAIYFGDKAYESENEEFLKKTIDIGVTNPDRHGGTIGKALPHMPLFWDFTKLFVENTDRAWRTFGLQGWHYFNFVATYGYPPGRGPDKPWKYRYGYLKKPALERPEWVNPNFDNHREAMQSLLVYIAGTPLHTDKTHAFFAGENIEKQIAAVWDGPVNVDLNCT
jgi:beta-galactosidase